MNSPVQGEDTARLKHQGSEQAIQLALESKWEEAASLNRAILNAHPNDVDSWNRLGKSLLELGRYRDSRDAYGRALELDPVNPIAKRNLERLEKIPESEAPRRGEGVTKVAQDMFIEEIGKTGVTVLRGIPRETLATMTAGDEVYLKTGADLIQIENAAGIALGSMEPKLALRLVRLIESGNRYAAAIKSVTDDDAELIIKEIYRDPNQTRVSFPTSGTEGVRPYIKESLLRLGDDDDDDELIEEVESDDWDRDSSETTDTTVSFSTLQSTMERDDDEEEEE